MPGSRGRRLSLRRRLGRLLLLLFLQSLLVAALIDELRCGHQLLHLRTAALLCVHQGGNLTVKRLDYQPILRRSYW